MHLIILFSVFVKRGVKIDTWLKVVDSPSPKHQTELSKPSKVHATVKEQKKISTKQSNKRSEVADGIERK